MKLHKTLMATTALTVTAAAPAISQEMANSMTLVARIRKASKRPMSSHIWK